MNINNFNYRPPISYNRLNDKSSEFIYYGEHEKMDKQEVSYTSGWRESYCPNCGTRMEIDEE